MLEKVSVIMSTYKESLEWIELSLNSILNQTHSNIEFIIVVDDPSRDDLIALLKRHASEDKRIQVLVNERNRGLVYSLNRALKAVSSKYVLRMDADDISENDRIQRQLDYMEKYQLDLVGCQVVFIGEDGKVMFDTSTSVHSNPKYVNKVLSFQNCIYHPTWLVKTELYNKLGGYRSINYCEDLDFLLRAKNIGARMSNLRVPLVNYRYNTNGISRTNKAKQRCITKYLCSHRNEIELKSETDINSCVGDSAALADCEKYYSISQKAIDAKANGNYPKLILECIKSIVLTKNGKRKFIETLKDKAYFVLEKVDCMRLE